MALNIVIRRAASRVAPFLNRASVGSQRYLHHYRSAALFSAVKKPSGDFFVQRSFPSLVRHFSKKPKSDEALLQIIESEIQCQEDAMEEEEGKEPTPEGFPFEIVDNPGQQTVTLTREYQGETINVEVHMPDIVTGEENDDDDDDEEGEGRGNQTTIPLVVRVSKKNGPSLEFGCTAYPDEVTIDTLTIKDPENSEDQIAYEGPDFGDLDENLQKAFHKYLEIRGIKPSATNYLHGYMLDKDTREYTTWLKNLQKFVQA